MGVVERTPHFRGGTGEPLVLIHGFSNTWRIWDPVLPVLTEHHDVLAPTLAGHHGAAVLDEGVEPTVAALADVVGRQMDEAGFDTAHLAGNSLGGWIALELARRGRARSVVALAPAGGWARGREERRLRRFFTRNYRATSVIERSIERLVRRPRLRRLLLRDAMQRGDRMPPAAAAGLCHDMLGCSIYWDFMNACLRDGPAVGLDEVDTPVLIAWPARDRVVPEESCSPGFRAIAGAEWVRLPEVGHVPMYDDPPLIARTILDFARRHAGTTASVS